MRSYESLRSFAILLYDKGYFFRLWHGLPHLSLDASSLSWSLFLFSKWISFRLYFQKLNILNFIVAEMFISTPLLFLVGNQKTSTWLSAKKAHSRTVHKLPWNNRLFIYTAKSTRERRVLDSVNFDLLNIKEDFSLWIKYNAQPKHFWNSRKKYKVQQEFYFHCL